MLPFRPCVIQLHSLLSLFLPFFVSLLAFINVAPDTNAPPTAVIPAPANLTAPTPAPLIPALCITEKALPAATFGIWVPAARPPKKQY